MNNFIKTLFKKQPAEVIDGDYYFHADSHGDRFDESDADMWLNKGIFESKWSAGDELFTFFRNDICRAFSNNPAPFLEIACGPGMGLTPVILSQNPDIPVIAADASSMLIKALREFINKNLRKYDISLASFNIMDMPFYDESFDVVTSFLGIGSTRAGEKGRTAALNEVYRVLKKDGCFIAVENKWTDFSRVKKVFDLWGQPVWNNIQESWTELFTNCGFTVEQRGKPFQRTLDKDDNELGMQADKFGIDIGVEYNLYVLRKCRK